MQLKKKKMSKGVGFFKKSAAKKGKGIRDLATMNVLLYTSNALKHLSFFPASLKEG